MEVDAVMIEVKDCVNVDEIILTDMEYENIKLNKRFRLKKREQKAIKGMLYRRGVELVVFGEGMANQILVSQIRSLRPSVRQFRKYRAFNEMAYDVEGILHSNNIEFNLVKYFNMVCGMSIRDLADCLCSV